MKIKINNYHTNSIKTQSAYYNCLLDQVMNSYLTGVPNANLFGD